MTENMKIFLELVSKNEELGKKLVGADKEAVLAMAKELGIDLTDADFVQNNELSDDELDAVAGGKSCFCMVGGGGEKTGDGSVYDVCACVAAGTGLKKSGGTLIYDSVMDEWSSETNKVARCVCVAMGAGKDN